MIVMRLQANLLNMMLMLLPTFGFLSDKLLAFVLFVVAAAQAGSTQIVETWEPGSEEMRGNWDLDLRNVEREKGQREGDFLSYLSYSPL